jgi:hypothetical protein
VKLPEPEPEPVPVPQADQTELPLEEGASEAVGDPVEKPKKKGRGKKKEAAAEEPAVEEPAAETSETPEEETETSLTVVVEETPAD